VPSIRDRGDRALRNELKRPCGGERWSRRNGRHRSLNRFSRFGGRGSPGNTGYCCFSLRSRCRFGFRYGYNGSNRNRRSPDYNGGRARDHIDNGRACVVPAIDSSKAGASVVRAGWSAAAAICGTNPGMNTRLDGWNVGGMAGRHAGRRLRHGGSKGDEAQDEEQERVGIHRSDDR
jgi:hypothetical protein